MCIHRNTETRDDDAMLGGCIDFANDDDSLETWTLLAEVAAPVVTAALSGEVTE